MNIKITFDFHDIFVNSHDAWIKSFLYFSKCQKIVDDYEEGLSKKSICERYNLDYVEVEKVYRKYLNKIDGNIEFAAKLAQFYEIDIVSLSKRDRLLKDINKFSLNSLFKNIYSKEIVKNKKKFLLQLSEKYDWVLYFNHEFKSIVEFGNLIYIPIHFQGDISQFKNKSFTEHAKHKLLYNKLSKYYMQAIANDTNSEVEFIKTIYEKFLSKNPGTILDCCCGVGRHDCLLGALNYKVTGIDISKSQIDTAKNTNNNPNVEYKVMDVRNISLPYKKYDMSICMWTTYNYLSQEEDFVKFIKSNFEHQREGGLLILDSKNIPKLDKRRVYRRYSESEKRNIKMDLLVNKFVNNNIQNSQYIYFIKDNNKKHFDFDEEFVRFYTLKEIKKLVKPYYKVKFIYGDFDFSKYNKNVSNRFILVLQHR